MTQRFFPQKMKCAVYFFLSIQSVWKWKCKSCLAFDWKAEHGKNKLQSFWKSQTQNSLNHFVGLPFTLEIVYQIDDFVLSAKKYIKLNCGIVDWQVFNSFNW